MMTSTQLVKTTMCLTFLALLIAACGPPQTLTDAITEEEFRQEEFICQDYGLEVDFQPGIIVCSGVLDGEQVAIEIIAEVVNGQGRLQILRFSKSGVNLAPEEFADTNTTLAKDPWIPEEGYTVTSIVITDNDLTITRSLK